MKKTLNTIIGILVICGFFSTSQAYTVPNKSWKYISTSGPAKVYSDINRKFSKDHATHANLVWKYFSKIFANKPGKKIVLYYTLNQDLYNGYLELYPTTVIKGARQLTSNWNKDHRDWFIIPYAYPKNDFGTQLHEISHDFLYSTYPGSEDYPWFKEGSGMYYESGAFNSKKELVITKPMPDFLQFFKDAVAQNKLIPLETLMKMTKQDFYAYDFTKTYPQAMVFFFYLKEKYPKTMHEIFVQINNKEIIKNSDAVNLIISSTGKNFVDLEKEYIQYGTNL